MPAHLPGSLRFSRTSSGVGCVLGMGCAEGVRDADEWMDRKLWSESDYFEAA